MIVLSLVAGATAALIQTTVLPQFFLDAWTTPFLPAALVATWATTRQPIETWRITLISALILGVMSSERVGWFLLALLPISLIAVFLHEISAQNRHLTTQIGRASATALTGTICYFIILTIVAGKGSLLLAAGPDIAIACLGTMALAIIGVLAVSPFRKKPIGLF